MRALKMVLLVGTSVSLMTGCEAAKPKPKLDMTTQVLVKPGELPMVLGEVLGPFSKNIPAVLESRPANISCSWKKPKRGSYVANITSYENGKARAPLYFAKELSVRDQDNVFQLKPGKVTDVIVTYTESPVSLTLTGYGPSLYVVHTAPGVEIDSINIMSQQGAALVAPQVDKSRISFLVNDRDTRRCWNKPERYFNAAEQRKVQPANYTRTEKDYAKYRVNEKVYKDWLGWLRRKNGKSSDANIDREYSARAALVGPAPVAPIEATPLGGTVYIDHSRGDAIWASRKEAEIKFPPPKRK